MKKIIYLVSALFLAISTSASALIFNHGPYFGGQIGWGQIGEGDGYKLAYPGKEELGTFTAWRAYAGYSIAPVFSIEMGYTHLPANEYNNLKNETYGIDLVGKLIIPFAFSKNAALSHFSIYGKFGGIYLNTKLNANTTNKKTTGSIRPTYGAGLIFNFTENIALDASWMGATGKSKVKTATEAADGTPVPSFNMFTLGLSYKITGIF